MGWVTDCSAGQSAGTSSLVSSTRTLIELEAERSKGIPALRCGTGWHGRPGITQSKRVQADCGDTGFGAGPPPQSESSPFHRGVGVGGVLPSICTNAPSVKRHKTRCTVQSGGSRTGPWALPLESDSGRLGRAQELTLLLNPGSTPEKHCLRV